MCFATHDFFLPTNPTKLVYFKVEVGLYSVSAVCTRARDSCTGLYLLTRASRFRMNTVALSGNNFGNQNQWNFHIRCFDKIAIFLKIYYDTYSGVHKVSPGGMKPFEDEKMGSHPNFNFKRGVDTLYIIWACERVI